MSVDFFILKFAENNYIILIRIAKSKIEKSHRLIYHFQKSVGSWIFAAAALKTGLIPSRRWRM